MMSYKKYKSYDENKCTYCQCSEVFYKNNSCIICCLINEFEIEYDEIYVYIKNNFKNEINKYSDKKDSFIDDEDCEYLINIYDTYDTNIISNPIFKILKHGFKNKKGRYIHEKLKSKYKEFYLSFLYKITEHTENIENINLDFIDLEDRQDIRKYFFNNMEIIKSIESIINYYIDHIEDFLKAVKKFKLSLFKILVNKPSLNSLILSIMFLIKKLELISINYDILLKIKDDYYKNKYLESFLYNDKALKRYNTVLQILKSNDERILIPKFFMKIHKEDYNQDVYVISYEYEKIIELREFFMNVKKSESLNIENINNSINKLEENEKIKLNNDQLNSINMILNNNISIVTGGPGTGKSTLCSFLVSSNSFLNNFKFLILTPTGKAAARLKNDRIISKYLNDPEIYTIHSLFYKMKNNEYLNIKEEYDNDFPKITYELKADIIIIDESSMLSYTHMNFIKSILLKNKRTNYNIVLIGDSNQLPAIGLGDIFYNLQKLNIKNYNLVENKRSGDNIITLLEDVKNSNKLHLINYIHNFNNITILNHEDFIPMINSIYKNNKDIQCLSAKNITYPKNTDSAESNIFLTIQKFYKGKNSPFFEKQDKVYNKKNLYFEDYNIMNGFTGNITKVQHINNNFSIYFVRFDNNIKKNTKDENQEREFVYYKLNNDKKLNENELELLLKDIYEDILYKYMDEKEVEKWYEKCDISNLDFSYILTVHKFQGSEADTIIFFIDRWKLIYGMDKKLVYTALSRAQKHLYIVLESKNVNPKLILQENNELIHHNDVF